MKKLYLLPFTLAILLGTTGLTLQAQQEQSSGSVIIVQKIKNDDGTYTVKKKSIEKGQDLETYVKEFELENADKMNAEVIVITDGNKESVANDGETVFMIRSGNHKSEIKWGNAEELKEEMKHHHFMRGNRNFTVEEKLDPNKAYLGVYPSTGDEGVLLTGIVNGSGAEAAGLQTGDVMTVINGTAIRTNDDLKNELAKYVAGNVVTIAYLRDGQSQSTNVTLSAKKSTTYTHTFTQVERTERNPCEVFIGVYVGSYGQGKEGVGVSGIIPGWPAEAAGLQAGDRIIAIDGYPVNSYQELTIERNKHKPGEYFLISYLRNEEPFEVKAQFKSCPTTQEEKQPEKVVEETLPAVPAIQQIDNTLQLEQFSAYPNPTYGKLNVQFRGEAIPTVVTITDVNGKIVHQESLPRFDGYYNRELDISAGTPGTLMLSVRQEGKVRTEPIVLLNRA